MFRGPYWSRVPKALDARCGNAVRLCAVHRKRPEEVVSDDVWVDRRAFPFPFSFLSFLFSLSLSVFTSRKTRGVAQELVGRASSSHDDGGGERKFGHFEINAPR